MESWPDIVVLAPDLPRVELAVEIKSSLQDRTLPLAEAQLKWYMRARGCAAGLIVSPEETHLYEDRYLTNSADSIEHVGVIPTRFLVPLEKQPTTERDLLRVIEAWLERLVTARPSALPTHPQARELVQKYVLPAVAGGRVTEGG